MGDIDSKPKTTRAQYEAAEERLRHVQREAAEGFEAAKSSGDLSAAHDWHEALKTEFDYFRDLRDRFPQSDLLQLTSDRIRRGWFFEDLSLGTGAASLRVKALNVTIPGGTSDLQAIDALRFAVEKEISPYVQSISSDTVEWLRKNHSAQERETAVDRLIRIVPVIPGSQELTFEQQQALVHAHSMRLAEPLEQCIAALVYFAYSNRSDLFHGHRVRGSTPDMAVRVGPLSVDLGVRIEETSPIEKSNLVGVSGVLRT